MANVLKKNRVHADCMHGDMTQYMREQVMRNFATRKIDVLVATDIAARGLHIENITHVFNCDLPGDYDTYTHRIGRTARNGKTGTSITFYSDRDEADMKYLKELNGTRLEEKNAGYYEKIKIGYVAQRRNIRFSGRRTQ